MPDNDKKQAYLEAQPGDLIRAEDWNKMQVKIRKALNEHNHHGGLDQGGPLDAGAIDPGSELTVKSLNIKGALTVNKAATVSGALSVKDTLAVTKDMSVQGNLMVTQNLVVGDVSTRKEDAKVHVAGDVNITGNLKVDGFYHGGGAIVEVQKTGQLAPKPTKDWFQVIRKSHSIHNDSIILISIAGSWKVLRNGQTAYAGAMIDGKSLHPMADGFVGATVTTSASWCPIAYSTIYWVDKSPDPVTVGLGIFNDGGLAIDTLILQYCIIPK